MFGVSPSSGHQWPSDRVTFELSNMCLCERTPTGFLDSAGSKLPETNPASGPRSHLTVLTSSHASPSVMLAVKTDSLKQKPAISMFTRYFSSKQTRIQLLTNLDAAHIQARSSSPVRPFQRTGHAL